MPKQRVTVKQQKVMDYIAGYLAERRRPPTLREMALFFGWRSVHAAQKHVAALIRKGLMRKDPRINRGLQIVPPPESGVPRPRPLRMVPLLGRVPAGGPMDAVENLERLIGIDPEMFPEADIFALRVKGESMSGAGIRDGDIALVRQTSDARDGDLVVALVNGEATLKRFFLKEGHVLLRPENPAFADIVIPATEDFSLAGVVVGVTRRI